MHIICPIIFLICEEEVQPVSPKKLSLVSKTSNHKFKKKKSDTLNLVPKKPVFVIAFQIALTLDAKIVWFGCHLAVCVKKQHKMQF